jgi:hypothetical protein
MRGLLYSLRQITKEFPRLSYFVLQNASLRETNILLSDQKRIEVGLKEETNKNSILCY